MSERKHSRDLSADAVAANDEVISRLAKRAKVLEHAKALVDIIQEKSFAEAEARNAARRAEYDGYGDLVDSTTAEKILAPPVSGEALFYGHLQQATTMVMAEKVYQDLPKADRNAYEREVAQLHAQFKDLIDMADAKKAAEEKKHAAERARFEHRKATAEKAKKESGQTDRDRADAYRKMEAKYAADPFIWEYVNRYLRGGTGVPFAAHRTPDELAKFKKDYEEYWAVYDAKVKADARAGCKCTQQWCCACYRVIYVPPTHDNNDCPVAIHHRRLGSFHDGCGLFRCDIVYQHDGWFDECNCYCPCFPL